MMWAKYLVITLLFYLFGVLQNSFLVHFSIFGVVPNFILITYFLLIFFEEPHKYPLGIFGAFTAGFFLDIFSHNFFGISIIFLLVLMLLTKKALQLLWEKNGEFSVFYFLPLFAVYLLVYKFFTDFNISWTFIVELAYCLAFAVPGFYFCKRFNLFSNPGKQLRLF